jgi:hypothetical protein
MGRGDGLGDLDHVAAAGPLSGLSEKLYRQSHFQRCQRLKRQMSEGEPHYGQEREKERYRE